MENNRGSREYILSTDPFHRKWRSPFVSLCIRHVALLFFKGWDLTKRNEKIEIGGEMEINVSLSSSPFSENRSYTVHRRSPLSPVIICCLSTETRRVQKPPMLRPGVSLTTQESLILSSLSLILYFYCSVFLFSWCSGGGWGRVYRREEGSWCRERLSPAKRKKLGTAPAVRSQGDGQGRDRDEIC